MRRHGKPVCAPAGEAGGSRETMMTSRKNRSTPVSRRTALTVVGLLDGEIVDFIDFLIG